MDLLDREDIVMSITSFFMLNILSGCEGVVGALYRLRESCYAPSVEDVEVKGIIHSGLYCWHFFRKGRNHIADESIVVWLVARERAMESPLVLVTSSKYR